MNDHNYPWEIAPLWAKYAATDANSEIWFYEAKPEKWDESWSRSEFRCIDIDQNGNGADWENSLREIPEREAAKNALADACNWAPMSAALEFSFIQNYQSWEFTPEELQERRQIRIKASLIEPDTKEPESVEDDLTWLARNVIEWHEEGDGRLVMIGALNSPRFPINCRGQEGFTQSQWLQRRIELGLATNPAEQPVSTEWDGEGLPPVGVECEVRFRHPGTDYSKWYKGAKFKAGFDSKIWFCAKVEQDIFIKELVLPSHDVEFRPIDSEAKQREEDIEAIIDIVASNNNGTYDDDMNIATAIYDWLIETDRLVKDGE